MLDCSVMVFCGESKNPTVAAADRTDGRAVSVVFVEFWSQKYDYQRNLEWNSYPIFHIEAYVICQWYPTHLVAAIPLRLHFVDNVKVHPQRATLGATV
jgi:hypothetical protein